MEVAGVEPASLESLAPASPSAAVVELSGNGTPTAGFPLPYPGSIFALRSRTPEDASCIATPGSGEAGAHRMDGLRYLGSQCEVVFGTCVCFRLFYEDPETSARFRRLNTQGRNHFTPVGDPSLPAPSGGV